MGGPVSLTVKFHPFLVTELFAAVKASLALFSLSKDWK